jgi:AraC-like DNA-binding protein
VLVVSVAVLFVVAWRDPEWLIRLRDTARESASASAPAPAPLPAPPPVEGVEAERQICVRLDALFQNQRSYAEFGLSLDDVARQLGVTSRQLSAAVNRIHGRGFRTLLNDYRVEDAARQLADAALIHKPITDVMFDAGFQTKSNFNKEFAARRSLPPSLYRKRHGSGSPVGVSRDAGA